MTKKVLHTSDFNTELKLKGFKVYDLTVKSTGYVKLQHGSKQRLRKSHWHGYLLRNHLLFRSQVHATWIT